nr:hypothetical protein [Tanacetum cinerariifolium]
MHSMGKTVTELHAMLKLHEQNLPKKDVAPALHVIRTGKVKKKNHKNKKPQLAARGNNHGKGKSKLAYAPKPKIPPPPKKGNSAKDAIRHQCSDMARKPYTHKVERAKDLLGLIHIDVCGPFTTVSKQGASYFVTFTDDFSRYGYVYLVKHKHEMFETFKVFQKEVENQLKKTIKSLCFDRGGEYMSQEFLDHLKEHMIIAHQTPPYTPQHNDVSKRRNRTPLDMVRLMMSQTTLPKSFWDYALESAACILNMVPTKKVKKTPYEIWHGQAPKMSYLKVWGCKALVKRDTLTKPDKLEPWSIKCIFIGYSKETMGYSFYYPPEHKIFVARNAKLLENNLMTQEASGSLEDLEIIQEGDTHHSRKLGDHNELANYKAALLDLESEKWLDAMNVEMQSMKYNEVWDLVDLPPDGKTFGSKWIFKKKTDMDGVVHTYNARLVAKGFTQTYGVDYEETFSPVADIRAIRILVAIPVFYDYEIWQIDVKTAFLNGHLSKEVYMVQPEGFVNLKCFAMKDLGEAAYILGIKIYRDRSKRLIGASTPAEVKRMQNIPYASAVGSIMYAVRCTRPDVAFAQNITDRFQQNLGDPHWTTVKKILKYLRNTKDMFLVYDGDMKRELRVSCYTDAGYLEDADDLKSQTGYEAVCIRKFISGLGVVPTNEEPIMMYCDNTRVITIANEPSITKGARHYHAKVYYLREVIELGDVKIEKVHTDDNLPDPFTRALTLAKHSEHT